jgi:butyrate kinase
MQYRILAINPGSTSTKITVFENDQEIYRSNIAHEATELKRFKEVQDQLPYRKQAVVATLAERGYDIGDFDIFVGRGGGLVPIKGGTYAVNDQLLNHAAKGMSGQHPAQLASQICAAFVKEYGGRAFVVNPPDVDEFDDIARITGLKDIYRESRIHALNQKEIALRYCKENGKDYTKSNFIICHIGGGISVTAHSNGRMIDSNDIINGDGPMTPTRSGALPSVKILRMAFSGKYAEKELYTRLSKEGGLIDHLGTADAMEIEKRIASGDRHAELVYNAMMYQIAKSIGSYACVLRGRVDSIILTGGISNSKYLVENLTDYIAWIAPVAVMAGEFEMEALAAGALRVVVGEEAALQYTGKPIWQGFAFNKGNYSNVTPFSPIPEPDCDFGFLTYRGVRSGEPKSPSEPGLNKTDATFE